jgi:hypothetical protein
LKQAKQTSEYHSPKFSSLRFTSPKPVSFFTSFFFPPRKSNTQHKKQTKQQTDHSKHSETHINAHTQNSISKTSTPQWGIKSQTLTTAGFSIRLFRITTRHVLSLALGTIPIKNQTKTTKIKSLKPNPNMVHIIIKEKKLPHELQVV